MRKNEIAWSPQKARTSLSSVALVLATVCALTLPGLITPALALNPIMHNGSSTTATYWGGGWGNTANSKYGKFTCATCHTAGLSRGNAKQVKSSIRTPDGSQWGTTGSATAMVAFNSYTAYGADNLAHTTSVRICEVCHSQTKYHRNNNTGASTHNGDGDCTQCHKHASGFKGAGVSGGGAACDGCHSDLYLNNSGYGMHSPVSGMSYKHYMDNALTTQDASLTMGKLGTSWYAYDLPDATTKYPKARRCLMCHVDHDQFNAKKGFNLRANATLLPTGGVNRDDNLCLSCHMDEKIKAYPGPNQETNTLPIPYPKLTYANATSVLNHTTHGYGITTTFSGTAPGNTFMAVCVKCHNDSIGKNGESRKSGSAAQKGTFKFGEHNSTIPGRFSVFSNDFYQRPSSGTTLTLNSTNKTVQVVPSPAWVPDVHQGHFLAITAGGGVNTRALITTNTVDTLTLQTWPAGLDTNAMFDISDDNMSLDNVCFNCHSANGEEKNNGANVDWYGQQYMSSKLEGIYDVFIGDSGLIPASVNRKTSVTVYLTKNTWTSGNIVGYQLKAPGGTRTISGLTAGPTASGNATYPYSYTLTLASYLTSGSGSLQLQKPSVHPLDTFGRHVSDERVTSTAGWNTGDQGITSTANSATAATSITDTTKPWSGSEFTGLKITFPGIYDATGQPVSATITGGGANTVTWTAPTVSGLSTTGGDNYYIGSRHTACADCHNTHASFKNPEGDVSPGADLYHITDTSNANVPSWYDNIWVGYLLRVRSSSNLEQIRYITGFNKATGQYTVSLPWTTVPDSYSTYEVLMSDKTTIARGQSGGRAGSGSSGVSGVMITSFPAITRGGGTLTPVPVANFKKIENVFDNLSTTGLGGATRAGQRDLCIRCHSNYAFGTATPTTPSGWWTTTYNTTGPGRSTDIAAEFNPQNVAHHAVYARGNNQPITPTGTTAGATSYYNTNWPAYSTGTIIINTDGTASISGGTLPSTVIPGWYVYRGTLTSGKPPATATSGYYQITSITSQNAFTVTPSPATQQSGTYAVSAGLGNSFVPPYGPWSVLRCTDCHGSTKSDPVGPHASINKWLIKDADTNLQFEWYDGTTVTPVNYQTPAHIDGSTALTAATDRAYFCYNCHRADVYGIEAGWAGKRSPVRTLQSRVSHGQMSVADGSNIYKSRGVSKGTAFPQFCRHCHAGDKMGGIHGSNMGQAAQGDASRPQSVRFLNGASWNNGVGITTGRCYTQGSSTGVSGCAQHSSGTNNTFTVSYPYTGY